MNYLYIALFYFYTKILKVQNQYAPIVSISAVLSILIVLFIMILIENLNLQYFYKYSFYLKLILIIIYFSGWFLFYNWYLSKEEEILQSFKKKTNLSQVSILFFSWILIVSIISIWFKRYDIFR